MALETALGWMSAVTLVSPVAVMLVVGFLVWHRGPHGESAVVRVAKVGFVAALLGALSLFVAVAPAGEFHVIQLGHWFVAGEHAFELTLLLDRLSTSMALLTTTACALIGHFSATYLHADRGLGRFYFLLALFAAAMLVLVLAGSIDFLFVGWELVGLTSALLIGYFYERRQPVLNGLRAFATYRVCDLGLLIGIIMLHHYARDLSLAPGHSVSGWISAGTHLGGYEVALVASLLLVGAMGKSAQVPFGGWLPRAMEGPTPSSAIFYGALSVHAGVYLLIRAIPLFEASPVASGLAIAVGLSTAVFSTLTGRAQSDVKNALAYATMTQVGLMFIEVGLHLPALAAVHLLGHAVLRTSQFLRAPAILHELHELQGALPNEFETGGALANLERRLPGRVGVFLYQRALDGFYFDAFLEHRVAAPMVRLARWLARLDARFVAGPKVSAKAGAEASPPPSRAPALRPEHRPLQVRP